MLTVSSYNNPIKFNWAYRVSKIENFKINKESLKEISKAESKIQKEIEEYTKEKGYHIYANYTCGNVCSLYVFKEETENNQKIFNLIKKAYIPSFTDEEKRECVKSLMNAFVDLLGEAKLYKVVLKDIEPPTPEKKKKTTIIIKTAADNPKSKLLMDRIKWFLIVFAIFALIANVFLGICLGIMMAFTIGRTGKIEIDGVDESLIPKKK